jgi:HEXXH motif-containing protein
MTYPTMSAEAIARALAVPAGETFERAVETASIQIAGAVFELLEQATGSHTADALLRRAMLAAEDGLCAFTFVWSPAMAESYALLTHEFDTLAYQRANVRSAAHALARGLLAPGRVTSDRPCAVLWRDVLLPGVIALESPGHGADGVTVTCEHGGGTRTSTLPRNTAATWRAGDLASATRLPSLPGRDVVLVDARHVRSVPEWDLQLPPVEAICDRDVRQVQGALDMLERVNPHYRRWVTKTTRYVQMIESPDGRLESGSVTWQWGNIGVARLDDRIESICATCEMLIHESSHQYFHLVSSLGPVAADDAEYFSPFPRAMRPLPPILLGAHAFVNVLGFYRDLPRVHPEVEGWCARQASSISRDVEQVRPLLEDTTKLTPLGQALTEPIVALLETLTTRR